MFASKLKDDIFLIIIGPDIHKPKISGVARGVAGVAKATPIFQIIFNKFGQKFG